MTYYYYEDFTLDARSPEEAQSVVDLRLEPHEFVSVRIVGGVGPYFVAWVGSTAPPHDRYRGELLIHYGETK